MTDASTNADLSVLGDITFWAHQLAEHALFLQLGLEVEPYKTQAGALHADWERARTTLDTLVPLATLDMAKAVVTGPTKNLAEFKQTVLAEQKGGKWMGWLFPLFVDHMLRELNYFAARVWHGGLPANQTFCENVAFMQEHAEFAAHLLDPTAGALIKDARSIAEGFAGLHQGCFALTEDFVALGRVAGQRLDAYLRDQPVSAASGHSVIHPVLADHVIREGQRFLATIDALDKEIADHG